MDSIATLQSWMHPRRPHIPMPLGTKRDLLSLIGKLHHATRVVRPGRAFIRSLIDASTSVEALDHHVSLSADAKADIAWWSSFVTIWNGVSLIYPIHPVATIVSDASGAAGRYMVDNGFS